MISEARKRRRAIATKRSHLFQKKLRVAVGERGLLEGLRDRSSAGQDYERRMAELKKFCTQRELKLNTLEEVDIAMTEYTDCLFVDARPASDATKMKAALESLHPLALRTGPLTLPHFKLSLKELKKRMPQNHRLAIPEELCFAISGKMAQDGKQEMALKNAMDFSGYLRPSESMGLRTVDVIRPVDQTQSKLMRRHVLLLAPFEVGTPTKVGEYDAAVIMDDSRLESLGTLVERQARLRLLGAGLTPESDDGSVKLWGFSTKDFRDEWCRNVSFFHMEKEFVTPYQNRHGGISRDRLLRLRSVPEVIARARWSSTGSIKHYEKSARLQEVTNKLGRDVRDYGEYVRKHFSICIRKGLKGKAPAGQRRR